jgi:hypothetical protein
MDMDSRRVKFWINSEIAMEQEFTPTPKTEYIVAVQIHNFETEIRIVSDVTPPEDLDLLGFKSTNLGNAVDWGFKFKVDPVFRGKYRMNIIQTISGKNLERWLSYSKRHLELYS